MTIDPETLRQIEELSADERPLLVLDVDDVVLEFLRPFPLYLERRGYRLDLQSPRLHGNVFHAQTGLVVERELISELVGSFFDGQEEWQTMAEGASEAMETISRDAEIVLLTAMPHRYRAVRRRHLDKLGLPYPLLTTEMAKGPAIRRLRGETDRPVAFVDDMPHNLISAREVLPDAHLFHLAADNRLRSLLPPLPEGITAVDGWHDARPRIVDALGL